MRGKPSLYLDSNIFLNVIYKEEPFYEGSRNVLERIRRGEFQALTSSVTILEIKLTMARLGDWEIADKAVAIIEDLENLKIAPLGRSTARVAADHVVKDGLTVHDAYHLATAITEKAEAFITRGKDLIAKIRKYLKVITPEGL